MSDHFLGVNSSGDAGIGEKSDYMTRGVDQSLTRTEASVSATTYSYTERGPLAVHEVIVGRMMGNPLV